MNRRIARVNISARFSNRRVGLNGISLHLGACLCFAYYSLRVIPYQFPKADCPFPIVNEAHTLLEFFGHAWISSSVRCHEFAERDRSLSLSQIDQFSEASVNHSQRNDIEQGRERSDNRCEGHTCEATYP